MAQFHDTLNKKLWNDKDEMKDEVKAKLNQIANAFIKFLEIPEKAVKDIVVTGSSASYNYTEHSDIDLHLVIDTEKVHKDCPIVGEYLLSKKSEFNQKHDIYIYGIPVEVYAEPEGQGTVHNGLYSLKTGWVDYPQKIKPTTNDMAVKAKYEEYAEAAEQVKDGDIAEILLDKIKKMRKAGLAEGGEFSVENLVFKKLRDSGVIERLMKVKKEGVDKKLSLEEAVEILENLLEDLGGGMGLNTSTSVMAPYPTTLAGQEQPSKYTKEGKKRQKKAQLGYKYKKTWGKKSPIVETMGEQMRKKAFQAELERNAAADAEREAFDAWNKSPNDEVARKRYENAWYDHQEKKKAFEKASQYSDMLMKTEDRVRQKNKDN